jgi:hypothetical protein
MKLIHYERRLDLVPLYEQAIEISQYNFKRDQHAHPLCHAVSLGMGRQTGQTTAIKNLKRKIDCDEKYDNTETFIIVPNRTLVTYSYGEFTSNVYSSSSHFRGRSIDRPIAFIFDSCSYDFIKNFLDEVSPAITARRSSRLDFILIINPT